MASYKMAVPGWLAFTEHDMMSNIAAGIDYDGQIWTVSDYDDWLLEEDNLLEMALKGKRDLLAISDRLHRKLAKWKEARTSEQALEQL